LTGILAGQRSIRFRARFAPLPPARVRKRFDALVFSGLDKRHDGKAPGERRAIVVGFGAAVPGASTPARGAAGQ